MKAVSRTTLIDRLENQVEQHLQQVTARYQNLEPKVLLQAAANGGWSITQCLEHLNSYGRYYLPAMQKAINSSADQPEAMHFKSSWLGAYFTRLMQPGAKSKAMKAPKEHNPRPDLDPAKVIAEFIEQQESLQALLRAAKTKDLNRIRISISIAQWIRLKLGDVFGFLTAHNERHLQQAARHLQG